MAFNKASALKIVNPIMATVAAVQLATMVMFTFFSENIPADLVRNIHVFGGYALALLVATHIYLNWYWIKSTFLKKRSKA